MTQTILKARTLPADCGESLRIAVLYDTNSTHVGTIKEHLESFERYLRHSITFIPGSSSYWLRAPNDISHNIDLSIFDAVIVHYSIRLSLADHLDEGLAKAVEKFNGLKLLFIQDEYECTEIARSWMDRLKFDVVYTCVPQESLEYVYPSYRFPETEFLPTLTGYVPEDPALEGYSIPLQERKLLIAYRGRKLPAVYGELGQEKYRIGVEMKNIAGIHGLPVDVEVDESKRIYGTAWYRFLGSARATLGTESGANVFDFDGSLRAEIRRLEAENPEITFEEISAKVLAPHEGRVLMNQISPKIFEAIRLRTALVLFEGSYSGVVFPYEHYIPLKKDFSNIDEVLAKLEDDEYLQSLTERAYQDIVASGKYSYKSFVEGIDADIKHRLLHCNTHTRLLRSLYVMQRDGSLKQALPAIPIGISSGPHPLGRPLSHHELLEFIPDAPFPQSVISSIYINIKMRSFLRIRARHALRVAFPMNSLSGRFLRMVWTRLPILGSNKQKRSN